MRLTYLYSAATIIETPDCRILTDPWFGLGNNWDGSWTAWPPPPPLGRLVSDIGPVDYIWVSHLHDDHFCPEFIRAYCAEASQRGWKIPQILTSSEMYLLKLLTQAGLDSLVMTDIDCGETRIHVRRCSPSGVQYSIDSALCVRWRDEAVINLNDCPYDEQLVEGLRTMSRGARTLACLPYLGAGEYPQTYFWPTIEARFCAMTQKRAQFLDLFEQYVRDLTPDYVMPFAGEYYLRGRLARLNQFRGLPDALDAALLVPGRGAVMYYGGTWDVTSGQITRRRGVRYDSAQAQREILRMPLERYRYERELLVARHQIVAPLLALIPKAAQRACERRRVEAPYWYCLTSPIATHRAMQNDGWWAAVDLSGQQRPIMRPSTVETLSPREEVIIDARHLFGLMTGIYHWNTAIGGSHLQCRREPNVYRAEVYEWLNHFHA